MVELVEAFITNGVIAYNNAVEGSPETREISNGATYITTATEAVPAFFTVDFKVESTFNLDGRKVHPYISISVPAAFEEKAASFREIEDAAVAHVAPMLRQIADSVERQLAAVKAQGINHATVDPELP